MMDHQHYWFRGAFFWGHALPYMSDDGQIIGMSHHWSPAKCEVLVNWLEDCRWSVGCLIAEGDRKINSLAAARAVAKVMRQRGGNGVDGIIEGRMSKDPEAQEIGKRMVRKLKEWRACLTAKVKGCNRWRAVLGNFDIALKLSSNHIIPSMPQSIVPRGLGQDMAPSIDMKQKAAGAERSVDEWFS